MSRLMGRTLTSNCNTEPTREQADIGGPPADGWLGKGGGDGGVKGRGKDIKRRRQDIDIVHANTLFLLCYP